MGNGVSGFQRRHQRNGKPGLRAARLEVESTSKAADQEALAEVKHIHGCGVKLPSAVDTGVAGNITALGDVKLALGFVKAAIKNV